ncbi:MAG: tRNA (guanine(46)-N(7))-methyltransferase TrmB [Actinomycetales bacterium]
MTIRTYKGRRGRLSERQVAALADPALLQPQGSLLDLDVIFDGRPVTLEIGFGSGRLTADAGAAEPDRGFLVADVFTPGVADLLIATQQRDLRNIAVVHGDALVLLRERIADSSLHGVRTWFPDPWPKARHHKRRLVNHTNAVLIAQRCAPGAIWQLATDDADYAQQMQEVITQCSLWSGGASPRPERAVTHFEQRAIQAGRAVTDLRYVRGESITGGPHDGGRTVPHAVAGTR